MKTAVITGGSKGIGNATAMLFAREGYHVFTTYFHSKEKALELQKTIQAFGGMCDLFPCDVADSQQASQFCEFAVRKAGKVDVLINNAGISHTGLLSDMVDLDYNKIISTNLTGVYNMIHAITPHMVHNKSGKIINISSIWGITGASCEAVYSASKAAVIGLTKALCKELGPSNITVNAIAPGVIMTDMLSCYSLEDLDALADQTPLMRLGTPEDVANLALFLASDQAEFITGQVIAVDGGFSV